MSVLAQLQQLVPQLRDAFKRGSYDVIEGHVNSIFSLYLEANCIISINDDPSSQKEATLLCESLELIALTHAISGQEEKFHQVLNMLKVFYNNQTFRSASVVPETPLVIALHMLFLLVDNRLAEFHSEVERLSPELLKHEAVEFVSSLERSMARGANLVALQALAHPPNDSLAPGAFKHSLDALRESVRTSVIKTLLATSAVPSAINIQTPENVVAGLSVSQVRSRLLIDSDDETLQFLAQVADILAEDMELEESATGTIGHGKLEVPSMRLINETLSFAVEWERIV